MKEVVSPYVEVWGDLALVMAPSYAYRAPDILFIEIARKQPHPMLFLSRLKMLLYSLTFQYFPSLWERNQVSIEPFYYAH
jgi:hypothetical protein